MKVHLIKEKTIREFVRFNVQSEVSMLEWIYKLKTANWSEPADIKKLFSATDILGAGSNRVVFDIGGNKYRIIVKYYFGSNQVHLFVKWIGTHSDYTKICKENMQYTIEQH